MSENDRLSLADLNGATLRWEGSDGNIHTVEFEDYSAEDTGNG